MTASDLFRACFWQTRRASEVKKEGTRSTKTDIVLAPSWTGRGDKAFLVFHPRSTAVPLNLSREAKTFSCLLTSLPYQQVSWDTAWGGEESHSGGKQSLECVILSVCFCSACFPTTVCIWCRRLSVAEDLLQNTLKNDRFLERTLLCCCTEHKMCYPHLIPSFMVSVMTRGPSQKAGLVGRRANPHCVWQRRVEFKLSSVAMVSNAPTPNLQVAAFVQARGQIGRKRPTPRPLSLISMGHQQGQKSCIYIEGQRSSEWRISWYLTEMTQYLENSCRLCFLKLYF